MAETSGNEDWNAFVEDAAVVLRVQEEFSDVAPLLIEEPFNPTVQSRLQKVLSSSDLVRANDVVQRFTRTGRLGAGGGL